MITTFTRQSNAKCQLAGRLKFNLKAYRQLSSTYQGSNSWIILSNRITAKSRDANPETQAKKRTANVSKADVEWL